jgi:hypothetical protein
MDEPKTDTQTRKLEPQHAQGLALHLAVEDAAAARLDLAREKRARFVEQLSAAYAREGLELVGIDPAAGAVTVRPLSSLAEAAE